MCKPTPAVIRGFVAVVALLCGSLVALFALTPEANRPSIEPLMQAVVTGLVAAGGVLASTRAQRAQANQTAQDAAVIRDHLDTITETEGATGPQ